MNEANNLQNQILQGSFDEQLDKLAEIIKIRRGFLATDKAMGFEYGQRVQIVGNISPKYLHGEFANVLGPAKPGEKHVPVALERTVRKFRGGHSVKIPATCLKLVPAKDEDWSEAEVEAARVAVKKMAGFTVHFGEPVPAFEDTPIRPANLDDPVKFVE